MKETTKLTPDKLVMKEFKFVKEQIESPFELLPEQIEGFTFDMGHGMGFNLEQNLIKSDLSILINAKNKNEEQLALAQASFDLFFIFEVENLNSLVSQTEKNTLDVDGALASAIAAISYSTARGLLLARCVGTLFNNCILPIIDPKQLTTTS